MGQANRSGLLAAVLAAAVVAPAGMAQIATCLKNVLGPNACAKGMPAVTTYTCNNSPCPSVRVVEDAQCYTTAPVGANEHGKNNTLTPVPTRDCKYQQYVCQAPAQGQPVQCMAVGEVTTVTVYCPEIAGESCPTGPSGGNGGGND